MVFKSRNKQTTLSADDFPGQCLNVIIRTSLQDSSVVVLITAMVLYCLLTVTLFL